MSELTSVLPIGEVDRKLNDQARLKPRVSSQLQTAARRVEILEASHLGIGGETVAKNAGLPVMCLKRVLAYIDAHLGENITLAQLARNAGLSVYYFATQFRRSTGFSPHRYILHRRVLRARDLLRNTKLSVLDVSLDLGFQHQNNFARAFRRVTGMTPSHFRHDKHPDNQSGRMKGDGETDFERKASDATGRSV